MNGSKRTPISWWKLVLGIDLFLLLVTVLKKSPDFLHVWKWLGRHFNLAAEMNSAVWWSMASLLALAAIAYELFSRQDGKQKPAWLVLSIVLAGLSLDEVGSLHERTHGWNATRGIFLALLALLVVYSIIALYRCEATKRASLFIASAFFVFGSVAVQEYLERYATWPTWSLGLRVGVEEGSELLGVFLLFLGIVPQRSSIGPGSLRALIPNPFLMKNLGLLMLGGALVHSLASFIVPSLMNITKQGNGNPFVWYPATMFFLLFSATYWKNPRPSTGKPISETCLTVFFLLCSVASVYRLPKLFGHFAAPLPEEYLLPFFLFSLVAGLQILSWIRGEWSRNRKYFLGMLLMPPLCLLSAAPEAQYLVPGLLAYLVFHIFWNQGPLRRADPVSIKQNPRLT